MPDWHDVAELPERGVLWVYSEPFAGSGQVEMGTYSDERGWRSALNPEVTFTEPLAWAYIVYPPHPERRWSDPSDIGSTEEASDG